MSDKQMLVEEANQLEEINDALKMQIKLNENRLAEIYEILAKEINNEM